MENFLIFVLWVIIGLWLAFKRNWYKQYDDDDDFDFDKVCCIASVIGMPINFIIIFTKVFLINKWDDN